MEKKSITDIEVSKDRIKFNEENLKKSEENIEEKKISSYRKKNKRKKIPFFLFSISFFIAILILVISYFFHSTNIKVESKVEDIIFSNDVYSAYFNNTPDESVEENKNTISVGKIKITNNTNKSQTLINDTRFQVGEGDEKIVFKIFKRVKIESKKNVEVEAYSDGFGQKYNIPKTDTTTLKIPGFKEINKTNEYENIFGNISESFVFSDKTNQKPEPEEKTLGSVKYEIQNVSAKASKKVSSIGFEEVFEKATGKIKIINNTNKNQKLRKETRFQNGDLVYKTYKSTVIPANSSIIADAFADEAGRRHNISKDLEFNIPGFQEAKMDNEYKNITGVAYTDFKGGMIGKVNVPNKQELEKVKQALIEENKTILDQKTEEKKLQDEYIFLDSFSEIKNIFDVKSEGDNNVITLESIKEIPTMKNNNFISMILNLDQENIEKSEEIKIKDISNLKFNILNENNFDINSRNNIIFSLNGNLEIFWILNQENFKDQIKGKKIENIDNNLKNSFKNFNFDISIFPFWFSKVPEDLEKINIEITK